MESEKYFVNLRFDETKESFVTILKVRPLQDSLEIAIGKFFDSFDYEVVNQTLDSDLTFGLIVSD